MKQSAVNCNLLTSKLQGCLSDIFFRPGARLAAISKAAVISAQWAIVRIGIYKYP